MALREYSCKLLPHGQDSDIVHQIPGGTPEWPADKIENLMAEHCPLKRCAEPQDVARVVAFLASEDGGWVNGKPPTTQSQFLRRASRLLTLSARPGHYHLWWLVPVDAASEKASTAWVGARGTWAIHTSIGVNIWTLCGSKGYTPDIETNTVHFQMSILRQGQASVCQCIQIRPAPDLVLRSF